MKQETLIVYVLNGIPSHDNLKALQAKLAEGWTVVHATPLNEARYSANGTTVSNPTSCVIYIIQKEGGGTKYREITGVLPTGRIGE